MALGRNFVLRREAGLAQDVVEAFIPRDDASYPSVAHLQLGVFTLVALNQLTAVEVPHLSSRHPDREVASNEQAFRHKPLARGRSFEARPTGESRRVHAAGHEA